MSGNRLDSLSRRSTPNGGAKPGLKFKPKAVARRTKEERDADAPVNAEEHAKKPHRGAGNAGRGGKPGNRMNRALAGTHVVSVGPLASGVATSDPRSSKSSMARPKSSSPAPEFLTSMIKKDRESRSGTAELDSDEEGDFPSINMSEEYRFPKEETELFPLRAPLRDTYDEEEDSSRSTSPEVLEDSSASSVVKKEEQFETDLKQILKNKDKELQQRLNEIHLRTDLFSIDSEESRAESAKLNRDHRTLVKKIVEIDNNKEKFLFVQLPAVIPEFKVDPNDAQQDADGDIEIVDEVKESEIEIKEDPEVVETEKVEETAKTGKSIKQEQIQSLIGRIGSLRIHKSGKLSMKIGNIEMDVERGADTSFLQEVIHLQDSQEEGVQDSYSFGTVIDKMVVTPKF